MTKQELERLARRNYPGLPYADGFPSPPLFRGEFYRIRSALRIWSGSAWVSYEDYMQQETK